MTTPRCRSATSASLRWKWFATWTQRVLTAENLRSELLDLWGTSTEGGLSTTRTVTRNTNQAVGVGDQYGGTLSVGFTPRFEPRENHRVEMPSVKVSGGKTLSPVA